MHIGKGGKTRMEGMKKGDRQMQAGLYQTVRLQNHTGAVVWNNSLPASPAPPPPCSSRGPAQYYRCISPPVSSLSNPIASQSTHSRDASRKRCPLPHCPFLQVSPCLRRPKYQRTNPPDSGRRSASSSLPLAPFPWML